MPSGSGLWAKIQRTARNESENLSQCVSSAPENKRIKPKHIECIGRDYLQIKNRYKEQRVN